MKLFRNLTATFAILLVVNAINGQDSGLNVGDKVASFKALADNGKVWKSKDFVGKSNLVVYFYPAAMTGGCTKQACAYRDAQDDLSGLNAEVVGISGDEVKNLELFRKAHNLNFTLLSDPDGEIAGMFGVPIREGKKSIEREVEGQQYTLNRGLTTSRWTYIIDKNGKIVYRSTQVNAAEDSNEVIQVLKDL